MNKICKISIVPCSILIIYMTFHSLKYQKSLPNESSDKLVQSSTNSNQQSNKIVQTSINNSKICPKLNDLLKAEWSDIFNVSKHQSKISSDVILQALKFMIEEVNENDPKLIDYVRTLIHQPSDKPLNLQNPNRKDFSQTGQSVYMDELFGGIKNGFIVEAGAYDGEEYSNSLFFERERNWNGILIEPIPFLFESLLSKNRKMYAINVCIAKNKPLVSKFKIAPFKAISGRDSEMSKIHQERVGSSFETIYVPCFSLNTILKAINVNKVDFFSLDLEGGEWDVLSGLDLENIKYRSFVIEHNGESRKELMREHLFKHKYNLTKFDGQDDFFIKIEQ